MLPPLPYNFHDATLANVTLGPRREVTIELALDDPNYPPQLPVTVRFGGISNYAEVKDFFEGVPPPPEPGAYRARIDRLEYDPHEKSKLGNLILLLELDYLGSIVIRCQHLTIHQ